MGSPGGRSIHRWRLTLAGAAVLAMLAAAPVGAHASGQQPTAGAETGAGSGSPAPGAGTAGRAFVLEKGHFTTFSTPFGDIGGDGIGINDRGDIVSGYFSGPGATSCVRAFLRDRNGRFTRIDFPADGTTYLFDINDRGQMVGDFFPSVTPGSCSDLGPPQAFVRDGRGRFTTIPIPGAQLVEAFGINNLGQVVGQYDTADGVAHGYVLDCGRMTTVDGPPGATGASVLDINDSGQMVGGYVDAAGAPHAFSLSHGRYTTIDAPGAPFTFPFGVNDQGQIAGFTERTLPLGDVHGFVLRDGAGGPFTPVDVPGAVLGTLVGDINNDGVVVGLYRTPAPGTAAVT
ncbi:MAG: hypothetical protein J2P45_04535 [Candidatus Dormibacteraeota bacterium]|nr:hypothetical protein [Candidatus Dormibacteraeota bacterium]